METSQIAILNRIFSTAVKRHASDVHLLVGKQPVIRVDDKLSPLAEEEVLTADFLKQVTESLLAKEQIDVLNKEKAINFIYTLENQFRFKVNVFFQKGYLSINCHLIPQKIKTPTELGLPSAVNKFTQLKEGLVILAGPFASGRTTTVVSILEEINKNRAEHIVTIERPIEFLFANKKSIIDQREVGKDTNSFTDALEDCQEEDVDILMVEEVAGAEEISLILDIANAGSLIFAMMNTDSVVQTIEKILFNFQSFERERIQNLLANVLEGIIVQRLLPKVGGGMILAVELLISNLAVKSIIRDSKIHQLNSVLQTSKEEGMVTLDRSLAELVKRGEVERDEAFAQAIDKESFKSFFKD